MKNNTYVVFHSHFYQPPREDPWSEEIEEQISASPYKNWNERITYECYLPNSKAHIITEGKYLKDIINNYDFFNFNFGPTLLDWLKREFPDLYNKIIESDKRSIHLNNGAGNAIAQIYNHIIMPLADYEDKRTEIIWGIEDFKFHFNREPVAIWLSETAIDYTTVDVLVEFNNLKYIILSPYQAEYIRKLGTDKWIDVKGGRIDTRVPYRLYSKKYPDRYINVFFYDGDLSHKISFEKLLTDGERLYEEIKVRIPQNSNKISVISTATDGETYGHHHKFGEMAVAYLFGEKLKNSAIKVTNFENILNLSEVEFEVKITEGEGSAWSCSHGVGRWYRDCGCKMDYNRNWNQKWRTPLRNSLNKLRDIFRELYINYSKEYFINPMEARNDYIKLLLDNSDTNYEIFFKKHLKSAVDDKTKFKLLKLLEIQRYSLLSFTSCAWFFDDITNIATLQILKYAAWAIFLNKEFEKFDVEKVFLDELEKAESNIPSYKNGKWIYLNLIKPEILTFKKIINYILIAKRFNVDNIEIPELYNYYFEYEEYKEVNSKSTIYYGYIVISNKYIKEKVKYFFISFQYDILEFKNIIIKDEKYNYKTVSDKISSINIEFNKLVDIIFNEINPAQDNIFTFNNLRKKDAKRLVESVFSKEIKSIENEYNRFFTQFNEHIDILIHNEINIAEDFRFLMKVFFEDYISDKVKNYKDDFTFLDDGKLFKILRYAKKYNIEVNLNDIIKVLKNDIHKITYTLRKKTFLRYIEKLNLIYNFITEFGVGELQKYLQEETFYLIDDVLENRIKNLLGIIKFDSPQIILQDKFLLNEYTLLSLILSLARKLDIEIKKYEKLFNEIQKYLKF